MPERYGAFLCLLPDNGMNESQRTTLTLFSYLQRDGQMKKWFTNKPREPPSFSEILIFFDFRKKEENLCTTI